MTVFTIHITSRCNLKCTFCNRPQSPLDIENKKLKEIITNFPKKEDVTIFFSGGEPTLRKDLSELINFSKKVGIKRVEIVTNGIKLSEKKYLSKLLSSGLDKVAFSIHSHIEKIENTLSSSNIAYQKKIKALDNLLELNVPVSINTVINKMNLTHLIEFSNYIISKYSNIAHIDFLFIDPFGIAAKNRELLLKLSEAEVYLYRLFSFCKEKEIKFTFEFIPFCYMQGYEEYMLICTFDPKRIGKLDEQSYSGEYFKIGNKVRKSEPIKRDFIKVESCKFCSLESICPGFRSHYVNIFGTEEAIPRFDNLNEIVKKLKTNASFY